MILLGLFLLSIVVVVARGSRMIHYFGERFYAVESYYLLFLVSALTLFTRTPVTLTLPYVILLPPGAEPWYVAHEAAHAHQYREDGMFAFLRNYLFDKGRRFDYEVSATAEELRVRLRFCSTEEQRDSAWVLCSQYVASYAEPDWSYEFIENRLAYWLEFGIGAHA